MLLHLSVRNFAVIDDLQLELHEGSTALTGETGAGKSILIDALELALGGRAEANMMREKTKPIEVSAKFLLNEASQHWLTEHQLDDHAVDQETPNDTCLLRRTVSLDRRSRGWVNGHLAPIRLLRELGGKLVKIYAQNAQQSLMHSELQRTLLDQYADHQPLQQQVQQLHQRLQHLQTRMAKNKSLAQQQEQLEHLRFQQQELAQENVAIDAIQQLTAEQRRLAHREAIIQSLYEAQEQLDSDTILANARTLVMVARRHTQAAVTLGAEVAEPLATLDGMLASLDDVVSALRHYASSVDCDAAYLVSIDERLARIDDMARKHGVAPLALAALKTHVDEQISDLEANQTQRAELEQQQSATLAAYHQATASLSASRQQAARALASAVTSEVQQLGMEQAIFSVILEYHPQRPPAAHGQDTLAFCVCTNPGQRSGPLSAIASGGELSRIALALHLAGLRRSSTQTLIFDEVDNGIGGAVGETVGHALARLGSYHQVLYITHLPQVAVCAAQHLQALKFSTLDTTRIHVQTLSKTQRESEIARMLAGQRITQTSLEHAKSMLRGDD